MNYLEEARNSSTGHFKIKLDEQKTHKTNSSAMLTETDRQKQKVVEKISVLEEEYRNSSLAIQNSSHNSLKPYFEGFWVTQIDLGQPEIQEPAEEQINNVFEGNRTHSANTIICWWRHRLRRESAK